MRVAFIAPYPLGEAPSQRFRFEQYFSALKQSNIDYDFFPFWSDNAWENLYKPGYFFTKLSAVCWGYLKRFFLLFKLLKYDYIFIHREFTPLGPPILEWILTKIFRKKIIFDFDDAIWIPNSSESNKLYSYLKFYSNTNFLIKWAHKVSCGNDYLCAYAKLFNKNAFYNPTTIDTENHHNKIALHNNEKFIIGWTGSHSTVQYLEEFLPLFKEFENNSQIEFRFISDIAPTFQLANFKFVQWSKENEIEELLKFDIGLMPLVKDRWANGKCGFKALQYMALGIPALVSPIGVNTKIVDDGVNGFICSSFADWKNNIEKLINDKILLREISSKTRQKIIDNYSVKSNTENFLNFFN